jgi:hypothetical protein
VIVLRQPSAGPLVNVGTPIPFFKVGIVSTIGVTIGLGQRAARSYALRQPSAGQRDRASSAKRLWVGKYVGLCVCVCGIKR